MAECKILNISEISKLEGAEMQVYVKVRYYCSDIDYLGTLELPKKDFSAAAVKEAIAKEVAEVEALKAMGT